MRRFFRSFGHAIRGIDAACKEEQNFPLAIVIAAAVISAAYFCGLSAIELSLIILASTIVVSVEAINSALERTLDKMEPNHHPLVGKIKDMLAGAVLITVLGAGAVGILLFWRHFS